MQNSKYVPEKIKNLFSNFFSNGHPRSIEAKKNIAASFLIKGLSIAVSLILVPLTIHYVNPTQYGIWLTLSSIIAWLSFFDIGFGNGLRNRFTEAKAIGNMTKARIYISTTYAVLTMIFTTVWVVFYVANFFIDWAEILNAPVGMTKDLSLLAQIVFSFFCLQIVLKTINTILIADQKPAKAAFFDLIGQILVLIIIFSLTKLTQGSIIYLGLTLGIVPILVLVISSFWFYRNKYKEIAPSFRYVNLSYAKDIMQLGLKFFLIQIAVIIIYQTSNIIIAHVCSPQDVTIYNVAFKYFGVATMVFSIIVTPFWSAFTDAYVSNEYIWMKKSVRLLKKIALAFIFILVLMVVVSPFVFKLWIGEVLIIRISISIMVALYVMTNIWNSLHSMILNGLGKIKLQLYVSFFCTLINIPLAILLGRKFGIEGVVLSAFLLNLLSVIYSPIQVKRLLNKSAKGIWNE
jgi:O-antigen/teichoic acid export membrane protein